MMNPDICNIHPQIRIYVYALADPRRSAGSGWIWIRTPRCSPSGAQRGFRISRPSDGRVHHLWKEDPDPQNLASCLNTPIWDGIRAQDPDPDGGPDPNSVLKTQKLLSSMLNEPRVAILGSEKAPAGALAHTLYFLSLIHI